MVFEKKQFADFVCKYRYIQRLSKDKIFTITSLIFSNTTGTWYRFSISILSTSYDSGTILDPDEERQKLRWQSHANDLSNYGHSSRNGKKLDAYSSFTEYDYICMYVNYLHWQVVSERFLNGPMDGVYLESVQFVSSIEVFISKSIKVRLF